MGVGWVGFTNMKGFPDQIVGKPAPTKCDMHKTKWYKLCYASLLVFPSNEVAPKEKVAPQCYLERSSTVY